MKTDPHVRHFDIQRKIVANMTTQSWQTIPHVSYLYEPDISNFLSVFEAMKQNNHLNISLNTVILKVITEGIKAAPALNSHIVFNRDFVSGHIHTFDEINISMPMLLPDGRMMTVNLLNFQNKSLTEMNAYIRNIRSKFEKTNIDEAMFGVSMKDTLNALKKGRLKTVLGRLLGAKVGPCRVKSLHGSDRRAYEAIPENERLCSRDLEQGTVTVSNLGSLYKEQRGSGTLIEIVPPQVCAFAVNAVQEKPVAVTGPDGEKKIALRRVLPLTVIFDHRALDFGDVVPFLKRLDEIFALPEQLINWA